MPLLYNFVLHPLEDTLVHFLLLFLSLFHAVHAHHLLRLSWKLLLRLHRHLLLKHLQVVLNHHILGLLIAHCLLLRELWNLITK